MPGQDQDAPCSGWAPNMAPFSQAPFTPAWTSFPIFIQTYATAFAIQVLWAATGRRFGMCPIVVRPFYKASWPAYLTYPSIFDPWGGSTGAYSWGLVGTPVGSQLTNLALVGDGSPPEIVLPGPVGDVTAVTIDGAAVLPPVWRVDGNRLVRQDGSSWPQGQDLGKPNGQVNTWSVAYTRGELVPGVVNDAAGFYAYQVARSMNGGACVLPNRVTSITRQGVSVQTVNIADVLDKGLTGIPNVDQVILTYNPHGARARPRVLSLDIGQYRPV
jgi:hypothetical protein